MKILQICNKVPYPPKDGGSIAIFNLARGIAVEGNQIDILSIETYKHPIVNECAPLPENISHESYFIDTRIKVADLIQNLFFSSLPYNAQRFINEDFKDKIIEKLIKKKYDIVQLEGLYLTPYVKAIRENSDAKIALRSHNIENEIWKRLHLNEKSFFKKIYLKILSRRIERMERKAINRYDFLVPITYRDAVEYQKIGNTNPSKVIQTGIPTDEICNKLTVRKERRLYFIGSLDWLPNQEGILWFVKNVWPMFNQTIEHVEFHIAGRNAPEWFIKEIDQDGIKFHGEVINAKLFAKQYDIMVVPLFSGGGMRVKIVEAMSLGKVVVTTPIGAEGLDIIPNYHAIVAEEPDDFATGIEVLMENTDFFTKLGENSIRFIKNNYTNRVLARELINFYQSNL
jgi:glycosyltransferase involved in cell wall biosynthesis